MLATYEGRLLFAGRHMRWFKHYHDASYSVELNELIDEFGLEGYARYWLLLELLTEKFDGETTKITLHFEEISRKVRVKFTKKLETFMQKLPKSSITFKKIREKVYEFEAPILLDLMDRDFKKSRKTRVVPAPKIETKIETKNKIEDLDKEYINFYKNSGLPKVLKITDARLKKLQSVRKEFDELGTFEGWCLYINKILATPFLMGHNNKSWKCNFDWIVNKKNALKILEGNYDSLGKSNAEMKQDKMLGILREFENERTDNNGNADSILYSQGRGSDQAENIFTG